MLLFASSMLEYVFFISSFFFFVLLPGYFLVRVLVSPRNIASLEKYLPTSFRFYFRHYFYCLFAPGAGLVLADFIMLLLGRLEIQFSFTTLVLAFSTSLALLFLADRFIRSRRSERVELSEKTKFDKKFLLALIVIWVLGVFLRTAFFLPDVLPQDTDLGHHMYFAQNIVLEGKIPAYDTAEVIVGEHLIFAFLSIVSGVSLLSALPLLLLFFFNLMAALSISFFTFLLTGNKKISIGALAFFGAYYVIDPPQGRYVNGGVVGNTFGNYLLCLILILTFIFAFVWFEKIQNRVKAALKDDAPSILALLLFLLAGILYTHHLSSFLLLFNLLFFFIFWIVATAVVFKGAWKKIIAEFLTFFKHLFTSYKFLAVLFFLILLPLFIYLPFYLESNAVETVARAPLKESHTGIEWLSLSGKFGWLKVIFATVGLVLLLRSLSWIKSAFIFSWFLPLFLLSFFPQIFNISIPSRRVATYLIFPLTVLAAYGMIKALISFKKVIAKKYWVPALLLLAGLFIFDGTADFRASYSSLNKFQETVELYEASRYLAEKTPADAVMLKDHSAIPGDSWIKFFLQRGYDYFISRTYDYKYEAIDPYNKVDICPREMVIVPDSGQSQTCYGQTQTNYVILKPRGDDFLFWKSNRFDLVYSSDSVAVFKKNASK